MAIEKTIALLHYPNAAAPPQGVWWWDGSSDRLSQFYADPGMQAIGAERMGSVAGRADSVDVEDFFEKVANSSPRPDVWAVVTLGEMTGPELLRFEMRRSKKIA